MVGTSNGIFTTDMNGSIVIPNLEKGTYIIEEIKAPDNYILENQSKTIDIDYGKTYTLEFTNKAKSGVQIIKIDAASKKPLKDAKFRVYKKNGEVVGDYETDGDGIIILDSLDPGWYKIVETKAPDGYVPDDTPKDVEVTDNQFIKVTFENKKQTSLVIKKIDEKTGAPLAGAQFYVEKQDGTHIGEFTTDSDGLINIPTLDPGWYVAREKKAPPSYILDETPKTVEVKTDVPTVVTFSNKPLSGLQIKKINSVTRQPIEGVEFSVSKMNGEKLGNYKTGNDGLIFIPDLEPGWYTVYEVKADGYVLDSEPKNVEIKWGQNTVLEVENKPISSLLIIKTDAQTRKPLEGVRFDVAKANGERVGTFTTNSNGRIYINDLPAGKYTVGSMLKFRTE